jgi:uridine monophosphate synthetase
MKAVVNEKPPVDSELTSFSRTLTESARAHNSLLCVGLDPREDNADAAREACFRLIEATAEYAAAFKANSAFFEAFGAEGLAALREVIAHVPEGIPVILDAKRGDIADTSEAYARGAFDSLGADALTVNPYLGGEALAPFLARRERGVFVLCKTSNPGADEFQGLRVGGQFANGVRGERALFEIVAEHAQEWGANDNVGLVVGATDPQALARVRALAPDIWLLVPGIGAQGGVLKAAVEAGLRPDGLGMLINVSRAIARAPDPRAQARRMRDEINRYRVKPQPVPLPETSSHPLFNSRDGIYGLPHTSEGTLAQDLFASGCVRLGEFRLKSGALSPIYLDLRRLVSHPAILRRAARSYGEKLGGLTFDRLAGIPYAGLPIATAIALDMNRPLIYPRREVKQYGTGVEIEGDYMPGETAAVVDDLATTGGTKLETIRKLEAAGLLVHDILVLIDREQGAGETLAKAGYRLHAVVTLRQLLEEWRRTGAITPSQLDQVMKFLEDR